MKLYNYIAALGVALMSMGCKDYYNNEKDPIIYGDTYYISQIQTDKAVYKPGETVRISIGEIPDGDIWVRYSHLGVILAEEPLSTQYWSWTPPNVDFRGYLIEVYRAVIGKREVLHTIAVDVSSDWTKFPRYGFLSSFGNLSDYSIESNIKALNRYHINGIQFYDWMYDHHKPLAGTVNKPDKQWPDLIGRTNYLSTVQTYINKAKDRGMKTMFYNLAFGALKSAALDGVKEEWYLFKDEFHSKKDLHLLNAPFRSSIYLTNPGNTEWQEYLASRHSDVYKVFGFDGYHIDQLGNRGNVYTYNGTPVDLTIAYGSFLQAMKNTNPEKRLVMNAVSQFGQQQSIARADVDFLYTEVWDEAKTYNDLASVILQNNLFSENKKQTVLAAYMNYAKSNQSGFVNLPGVLLTNAVIFSFGGAHLELGEHYLANEYFPNSNLQLKSAAKAQLTAYYDFLVGYQNLLRDGGTFEPFQVQSPQGTLSFNNLANAQGAIAVVGKTFAQRDVVHLINFTTATSMEWRDTNATQPEPQLIDSPTVNINVQKTVSRVWFASPDYLGGSAQELDFSQQGQNLLITLPLLKYWSMVVIEY
ncbi:MAG: glycoside hydrolase family 66 protein [Breznakibacter sp.]